MHQSEIAVACKGKLESAALRVVRLLDAPGISEDDRNAGMECLAFIEHSHAAICTAIDVDPKCDASIMANGMAQQTQALFDAIESMESAQQGSH